MFEQFLATGPSIQAVPFFLGEITEANFISAADLTTLVGMTGVGSVTNASVSWLKYNYKGKVTYLAKKPLRHNMTWEALDTRGLTKGTVQFTINGKLHVLKLPTGYAASPSSVYQISTGGSFNDLIYPIYNGVSKNAPQVTPYPKVASYLDADLGLFTNKTAVVSAPGGMTWCQELFNNNTGHMLRGYNDLDDAGTGQLLAGWQLGAGVTNNYAGWRPIIEEV